MPLGFSGGQGLISMGERYGERLAAGIAEGGAKIENALKTVTTNRQLQGLGATLSNLNPQSPDYPNKLIELKSTYPLAADTKIGQDMVSIGFKAHQDWVQTQQAIQQSELVFNRQKSLLGMRNAARPNGEVDLLGGMELPTQLSPQNPATRSGFSPSLGLDEAPAGDLPPLPQMSGDDTGALMGMTGELGDVSAANAAAVNERPTGNTSSLLGRALGPLREAQQVIGIKPSKTQVFSAIASEKRTEQQERLMKERQQQSEKMQEDRQREAERLASQKAELSERAKGITAKIENLKTKRTSLNSAITTARKELNKHIDPEKERKAKDQDYFAKKALLQADLERAGNEFQKLDAEIEQLISGLAGEAVAPVTPQAPSARRFDPKTRSF